MAQQIDNCNALDIEPPGRSQSNGDVVVNGTDKAFKIPPSVDLALSRKAAPEPSLLSPKSPSSVFTKSTLQNTNDGLISCLVLCNWDNIMGPKVRHLWMSESMDNVTIDTLVNIATHTLSGEICRDPRDSNIDTKFYVMKEKGIIVTSIIFGAMGLQDITVHSLSMIIPHTQMKRYLQLHDLCLAWISYFIAKLRILLEKGPTSLAMSEFTLYLNSFVEMLESLKTASIPRHISLSETAFHPDHLRKFELPFLRKAIMSHLMTSGHSLVIGNTASSVNIVIATLALFLHPTERLCSRYADGCHPWPYHQDLCLQGILKDPTGQISESISNVLLSKYPTTYVDVSSGQVKHTSLHKHQVRSHEAVRQQLELLWMSKKDDQFFTSRNLFHSFEEPETLVTNFLEEVLLLEPQHGARESYAEHFVRLLERKALAVIKYLEAETNNGKVFGKPVLKKLRQDLGLSHMGDLKIVMATAEKLRPGMYNFVCGDPKFELDQMQAIIDTM